MKIKYFIKLGISLDFVNSFYQQVVQTFKNNAKELLSVCYV